MLRVKRRDEENSVTFALFPFFLLIVLFMSTFFFRDEKMAKFWKCPNCGLQVKDEAWRYEKPERTICRNNHDPTQMILN
jgi:hypothetical protein